MIHQLTASNGITNHLSRAERQAKRAAKREAKGKGAKIGSEAKYQILQPLRIPMIIYLKHHKIKHSSKIKDIANKTFTELQKQNGGQQVKNDQPQYTETEQAKIPIDTRTFAEIKGGRAGLSRYEKEKENFVEVAIDVIVQTIISFFKHLKEKKKSGEPLTEGEEKALAAAEEVVESGKAEAKFQIGDFISDYWWLLLIGLFFMVKKQ